MELSVIIPVYNAEDRLFTLVSCINDELKNLSFEIILVNDGSRDNSAEVCQSLAVSFHNVRAISLRRNFGEHNAVMCGLNYVRGRYAVIMDDDFQNPPSEILKLLTEIKKGHDVVYSFYTSKKHAFFRNMGSWFTNAVATLLLDKPYSLYLSSFKAVSSEIIPHLVSYKGPFPYVDGLILRVTSRISSVEVQHHKRFSGRSGYSVVRLMNLYLNMFVNFSIRPLRIFTVVGLTLFLTGVVLSVYYMAMKFMFYEPPGWTSTVIFILLLSGFQILFLGLISEYTGKTYLDKNGTPQFVIHSNYKNGDDEE